MSKIKSKNTAIDMIMHDILSYITNNFEQYPALKGNPDFAIRKARIAIFCDGDFWHGYTYERRQTTYSYYWKNKIKKNMIRDRRVSRQLRREGWSVLRFWEHDIKKRPIACRNRIVRKLHLFS